MNAIPEITPVRCAIYTRKSTEKGLEQEFNSLDAQRESGEAYIKSQQHEGWTCIETAYDDGGFSGGNTDRPALKRLLDDVEAGKVDVIVVYKIDRLSRSLMDFARIMEVFDRHNVSFVSVTQQFSTTSSMGRLTLNILLSFAQFEREIISERTRDKIAAARKKGKHTGGQPVLGYDLDRERQKLIVNEDEAERVREMFALYLEKESLLDVAAELRERGWKTKQWITKKGTTRGGAEITKSNLHTWLTNPVFIGKVRYRDEVYDGEHEGIVDPEIFDRVQRLLKLNGRNGGTRSKNRHGALLKGLLHCTACNCRMTPSTTSRGDRTYVYYVCSQAQKKGRKTCPAPSVPAAEMERFVVEQIREVTRDPDLMARVIDEAQHQTTAQIESLDVEAKAIKREQRRHNDEMRTLVTTPSDTLPVQVAGSSFLPRIMAGPSTSYYTGYEGRQQTLEAGARPETARKPKKSRARWQRRIAGTEINNVIEIARKYDDYLAQPDVLGYRDVAEHFGVTKATVSYYLSLLRQLPQDFIEWLEACNDEQVLAFFSLKRLRPIARLGEDSAQRATLLNETEQLSTDLGERSDTVVDLLRLLGKQDQPSLPRREHRVIQLD